MTVLEAGALHLLEEPAAAILLGPLRHDLVRDEVLSEIFAGSAATRPDKTAIVFGERRYSYSEVDREAAALARGLVRLGIGPGRCCRALDGARR
jgi:non-ribosomal peptide synthetase component F